MRVLMVNYEFPPVGAGAAAATRHIAGSLRRRDHEVTVLTSRFRRLRGWSEEEGVRIFRCPCVRRRASSSHPLEMASFALSALFALPGLLRRRRIDGMIIFFSIPCGPLGIWGKFLSGTPYVISLRGGDVPGADPSLAWIHKWLQPLRRRIFQKSLAVVANSEGLKGLSERADPAPVRVIPNGVDADFFTPSGRAVRGRLLFAGRFQKQKNLFFLLEQMDLIARECNREFELRMVGAGPLERSLKSYADALGARDRISWRGWSDKEALRRNYREACCILNPSLYEGMPNVLLEAMACGRPAIASNVAGNDAVVRHGETGFLFDPARPRQFRKAVVRMLENEAMARDMGKKARARVERAFSWDNAADEYLKLLEGSFT